MSDNGGDAKDLMIRPEGEAAVVRPTKDWKTDWQWTLITLVTDPSCNEVRQP